MNYPNDAEVEVLDVVYERNDKGFTDILHGKYHVHVKADHKDTELIMTIFKCPKGTTGTCKENPKEFIEKIDCERFLNDQSGPWYMFAPAMDTKNICAETDGTFEFFRAHLSGKYLEKYMTVEEGSYRIRMLYHLPGESMDLKNLRGCIEIDFDVVGQ